MPVRKTRGGDGGAQTPNRADVRSAAQAGCRKQQTAGDALAVTGGPCANELLARGEDCRGSVFTFPLPALCVSKWVPGSKKHARMLLGVFPVSGRELCERRLPIRAAHVWSKALHVCTFPFKKGPQSLNSTATCSGYSSLLSQTRTQGNEKNAQEGIRAGTTTTENRGAGGPGGAGRKENRASVRNYESLFCFT